MDANEQPILDPAFVRQALDTPSPQRAVWRRLDELARRRATREAIWPVFKEHLSRGGPPSQAELDAFIARVKKNLVFVKGGTFWFGDWGKRPGGPGPINDQDSNKPPQRVTLTNYSIYKTRVTYADYDVYTRATNQELAGWMDSYGVKFRFPDFPLLGVTWAQANGYCQWLAKVTSQPFDLPTEAQWEYAARDGGKEVYFAGPSPFDPDLLIERGREVHRVWPNASISMPAGSFGVGSLGIGDMVGYGKEWVSDWYADSIAGRSGQTNPKGPKSGTQRVMRPASHGEGMSVVHRYGKEPESTIPRFRCALNRTTPWR